MGPIALFDKSFLQSLSVDESVWFDNFFIANVCPLFYIETLADLQKTSPRRTPEDEVRIIAEKFPQMGGVPCAYHNILCASELLGRPLPRNGTVPIEGGSPREAGGLKGVMIALSPTEDAFARWQRGEFREVERLYASFWRESLSTIDLRRIASATRPDGNTRQRCKNLAEVMVQARSLVARAFDQGAGFDGAMDAFRIPPECRSWVRDCWTHAGSPPFAEYAPYATHVMLVEAFFAFALGASLISDARPSNRVDIAYLHYAPFCQIFVSSDHLHRRCAEFFLRDDQEFVWGPTLKEDLRMLNVYYSCLQAKVKEGAVASFASRPPLAAGFLVTALWDRHWPRWRSAGNRPRPSGSPTVAELQERIRRLREAPEVPPGRVMFDETNVDVICRQRVVRSMRGSWYQVPKGYPGGGVRHGGEIG